MDTTALMPPSATTQDDVPALINTVQALGTRLREICQRSETLPGTGEDGEVVLDTANELDRLAVALVTMDTALSTNPDAYSDGLTHDFAQILHELNLALAATSDCCDKLEDIQNTPSVLRLFKMTRFNKLKELLQTLRNKFVVTRTVVREGTNDENDGRMLEAAGLLEAGVSARSNTKTELYTAQELSDGTGNTANLMGRKSPDPVLEDHAHAHNQGPQGTVSTNRLPRISEDASNAALSNQAGNAGAITRPDTPYEVPYWYDDDDVWYEQPFGDPIPDGYQRRPRPRSPSFLSRAIEKLTPSKRKQKEKKKLKSPTTSEATTLKASHEFDNPFPDTERMQAG